MPHRLLGSELITWHDIRTEQILVLAGVGLILFLALCALICAKCLHSVVISSAADIEVQAFWKPDMPLDQVRQAWESAEQLPAMKSITTYTPSQAMQQLKNNLGSDLDLSWVQDNPLPPTAVLHMKTPQDQSASTVVEQVQSLPGVRKVHSNPLEMHTAQAWTRISASVLWPLIAVLLLTQAVLLANTVRLTLSKLHTDIQVLRLVGATRWACHAPILIRMLILTLAGTTLALAGTKLIHLQIDSVLSAPPFHLSCPFFVWTEVLAAYLGASLVTGISCTLAIHRQGL